jgi:phosphate/phosphite/phosphonate ABC transporter binding protein
MCRAAISTGEFMGIKLVSLMADNSSFFYRELAAYLTRRAGVPVETVDSIPWSERERMLDRGEAQVGFICGLPYVRGVARGDSGIELLAAPTMRASRYGGQPVYYSDVIVRHDSPFQSFADLRGASWSYNEPESQSGYWITRYHLAQLGHRAGYFGRVVEAGAHQVSIRMVVEGQVDASAIDSTVLELELRHHPELAPLLRVVGTMGPSPIPPAVVSTRLPIELRSELRQALLDLHKDEAGRRLLERALIARFVQVRDQDYDEIRRMAREAEPVHLGPTPHAAEPEGKPAGPERIHPRPLLHPALEAA